MGKLQTIGQPTGKVNGLQIFFRDNRSVKFRQLPIRHTCLCEMMQNVVTRGWKDYFRNHYVFRGYKSLSPGEATLSFERDIILNLNHVIPDSQLPKKGGDISQHADIARSRLREISVQTQSSVVMDKVMIVGSIVFGLEALALIITFMVARLGNGG